MKSELATFFEVFPEGTVWSNDVEGLGYDIVLLGQVGPLTIDVDQLLLRMLRPDHANVGDSLLPEILRIAERSKIKLAFIRVQRRPTAEGPPAQSDALKNYANDLKAYLTARGAYFHDDWGDPDEPLSIYADGDHLTAAGRARYTERFAERHSRFFQ